jgi:hypothetical protein
MKKPEISSEFTLDDIEMIREYAGERYLSMSEEEFRTEIRNSSSRMQEKLEKIREKSVVHEKTEWSKLFN